MEGSLGETLREIRRKWLTHRNNTITGQKLFFFHEVTTLDRESIASQCMDIHRNPRVSKWISIKAWILISRYPFVDIYCLRISIVECPCMDICARISMWISMLVWIIEGWHPKNHRYPCWYPWIFINPWMDLLWILGPGHTLPHLKCITLVSVRSSYLPHQVTFRAFKSPWY